MSLNPVSPSRSQIPSRHRSAAAQRVDRLANSPGKADSDAPLDQPARPDRPSPPPPIPGGTARGMRSSRPGMGRIMHGLENLGPSNLGPPKIGPPNC